MLGIITGILTYFFGFVINLVDSAVTLFLEALGFSIAGFEEFFPLAADFYDVFIGFAIGLLFLQFIFQIFRNFGVMLDMEAEDPLKMTGKVFLFFGMIVFSRSINDLIIKLLMGPYDIFLGFDAGLTFSFWDLVDNIFGHVFTFAFMTLIYLIMIIIIGFQFIKFLMEVVERYIVFIFVLYTAPLAYSTGPYKSTAQIFKSWCRMLASQGLLLLLNVWCVKVFLSGLGVFVQNGEADFFYYLLLYAFLKFSQKIDTLLRIIGMNTASTGSSMRSIGGAVSGIALSMRRTGQAVGNMMGGGAKSAKTTVGAGGSSGGSDSSKNAGISMPKAVKTGVNAAGETVAGAATGGTSTAAAAATKTAQGIGNAVKGVGKALANVGGDSSNQGVKGSQASNMGKAVHGAMNNAKHNFANDVLSSAKEQMLHERKQEPNSMEDNRSQTGTEGIALANTEKNTEKAFQFNPETKEGISNLAKGLPHTSYNRATGSYEGGGFEAFTGEDANIVGSSELIPSDSYTQQSVKMPDGSNSTIYSQGENGAAQSVKFDKVDNGVITGSISPISKRTGEVGQRHSFTAVHDSIPGSERTGTARVSDGEGSSYYVSSHGDTSMFKPYTSSINPESGSRPASGPSRGTSAVSQISNTIDKGTFNNTTSNHGMQAEIGESVSGISGNARLAGSETISGYNSPDRASGFSDIQNSSDPHSHYNDLPSSGMNQDKNGNATDTRPSNLRKFSKNNPANFEIFKKDE